jgi:histidinol phosphatase-like enzyme/predicted kinase
VEAIGLSNVTLGQLQEALAIAPIASVQVELGPGADEAIRGGLAEFCQAEGIALLAHRPLGGAAGARRIERDVVLRVVADRHDATPAEVALAWLRDLAPVVIPLPGPTRPETAASLARVGALRLTDDDRARLDRRVPAARQLRVPRARRQPAADAPGDVVLVAGLPGAGKSTLAAGLIAQGYERLNRDEAGGRLADLLPALAGHLAAGRTRVVLDNTYGSRAARNAVIETAWAHGVPARCIVVGATLEEAQVNAVTRMVARHGRLLEPHEMKARARADPGSFAPQALFRHRREWEPPDVAEGFARVEEAPFVRRPEPGHAGRAAVFWYDGVLRAPVRAGSDEVTALPGRREALERLRADGWTLIGLAWHPEVSAGRRTPAAVEALFERTHEQLGVTLDAAYCPHGDGPPVCWCRKPLPGLGALMIARHRLDPSRSLYVGRDASDRAFARVLGFAFRPADEVFQG